VIPRKKLLYVSVAALAALLVTGAALLHVSTPARADAAATARADDLCRIALGRLAQLPEMNDAHRIATAAPQVVTITLESARDLLAIDAPAPQADAIRRYARHLIRQADLTTRLQRAARDGDRATAIDLIDALTANSRHAKPIGATIAPACGGSTRGTQQPAAVPASPAV
jgi:hypothetical protein